MKGREGLVLLDLFLNRTGSMKYLLMLLGVYLFSGPALAQTPAYIYMESEPSRPFYLRTADSLYSSAPGNYLILAPLGRLKGEIIVGFPGKQQAAFVFTLPDTVTDRGLVLRDMQDQGWRLVDWRKNEPLFTRRLGRQEDEFAGMYRRSDAFALRLSQVVNDSSILFYTQVRPGTVEARSGSAAKAGKKKVQVGAGAPLGAVRPLSEVKLISKTDTGNHWLLVYEVKEGDTIDRVEVEIEKDRITFAP